MQGDYWAGVSCGGRARGKRTVAVRGLEFAGPNRGSGTLAASAFARHCEATGVSLPRKGRAEADLSDVTNGTCGTNGTVNEPQLHLPHIAIAALLKPRNQKLETFLARDGRFFAILFTFRRWRSFGATGRNPMRRESI